MSDDISAPIGFIGSYASPISDRFSRVLGSSQHQSGYAWTHDSETLTYCTTMRVLYLEQTHLTSILSHGYVQDKSSILWVEYYNVTIALVVADKLEWEDQEVVEDEKKTTPASRDWWIRLDLATFPVWQRTSGSLVQTIEVLTQLLSSLMSSALRSR